jgi:tRNA (guanine37-N1)-methyltransferase
LRVPGVLTGGNHEDIRRWRTRQALGRTWQRRPDLLQALQLDEEQQRLLNEFINEYESGN